MHTVIPGLYASAPEAMRFDPSIELRAYLLQRGEGNLLVYCIGTTVVSEAETIEELGGVSRHYLSHFHEALFGCDEVAARLGAPVFCHENDRQAVSETCDVSEAFSERHMLGDDFEVIPTPGTTPGASVFLWDSGEHRCLFTGDTLYLEEGEWVGAWPEPSADRGDYVESLELIQTLDFDLLVPWAATAGQPSHAVTDKADAQRRIDAIFERMRHDER
jgi:glyoxylase-like metal-dependent hydrolase (beta-lactamase superfamily II)